MVYLVFILACAISAYLGLQWGYKLGTGTALLGLSKILTLDEMKEIERKAVEYNKRMRK